MDPNDERCYWEIDRRLIHNAYQDIPFDPPFKNENLNRLWFHDPRPGNVHDIKGYLHSWSGYRQYLLRHNLERDGEGDPLHDVIPALESEFEENGFIDFSFTFFAVVVVK